MEQFAKELTMRRERPTAALLLAAFRQGGAQLEADVGVSSALVQIIQGVVIVLLAGTAYLSRRRRRMGSASTSAQAPVATEGAA